MRFNEEKKRKLVKIINNSKTKDDADGYVSVGGASEIYVYHDAGLMLYKDEK
jgi:hypothetical protein